jgi:hypothetical protein
MLRAPRFRRAWPALVLLVPFALLLAAARPRPLPPLVFVSRLGVAGSPLVPGLGPAGRFTAEGGRLLVRESDGRVRELAAGRFFDVSDPSVSYDGRHIAFAAVTHRDSAWRIWAVRVAGGGLRPVTTTAPDPDFERVLGPGGGRLARHDDIDPCWLPDGRIVFASTRWPWRAQQGRGPVTNLFVIAADGSGLARLTSERNGAEEPAIDPATGRIVYARWFFSRFLAAADGVTTDPAQALPADTIDLWHAISVAHDGDHARLQGGDPSSRTGVMAYEPRVLADSTLFGVRAERSSMTRATRFGLQRWRRGFAEAEPLFGLGAARGWSAVAPCPLPDGRLLFSADESGTGNFKLVLWDEKTRTVEPVMDDVQRMELDAAVIAPRPQPPPQVYPSNPEPPPALPPNSLAMMKASPQTARFDCLNVFANGPVDSRFPDAPTIATGLRIRFFSVLPRPDRDGGDTLVLVHEAPVFPDGAVHVDEVPADVPTFEQLVDANGRVVRAGSGPAHVPGFNFTRPGSGTKCVGCHAGHSALPVAVSKAEGAFTNVAPSARVSVSSLDPSVDSARGLVDRRTVGEPTQVGWVSDAGLGQSAQLAWDLPVTVRQLDLHALRPAGKEWKRPRPPQGEVALFLHGSEVRRLPLPGRWTGGRMRLTLPATTADSLTIRFPNPLADLRGRPVVALAEVEVQARIATE